MEAKALLSTMKPGTQNYKVLDWLIYYGHITVMDMSNRMYINSPRDCIYKLRGYGINIESVTRKATNGKHYIDYVLKENED